MRNRVLTLLSRPTPWLLSAALVFPTGCSTLNSALEPTDADINAEAAKAYAEVKAKTPQSTNADWKAVVSRVSARIAAVSGENFQWETTLLESKEVNAWCMPGGKIAVYTGIMPVMKTEGALAAVLGHEVSHATLRHGRKGYARAIEGNLASMVFGTAIAAGGQAFCGSSLCKGLSALGGTAAGFAVAFVTTKYSRADETAADKQGQIFMAKAGYDPAEAIRLWDRMSAASGGSAPPEFLSDHPSDVNRKNNLSSWLPATQALYANAPTKYGTGEAIK